MAGGNDDTAFLARLVHRGYLEEGAARKLFEQLKSGGELDALLVSVAGWSEKEVRKMRRTNAGEIPEFPGYEILGKLGVGGTAEVFRARATKTGKTLALKVLRNDAAKQRGTLQAFVAEAKLLQRLDHKGLVTGFGVAKSGNTYFNRLEYIPGRTLLEWLDDGRQFDEASALRVILETAEVLQYLETQDIVHRDVKPGNIMLTDKDAVVLIDLGFAAEGEGEESAEGSTVGTVAYLSPEQARGAAGADSRSDIYSLGVSLFHIVVGRLPFESTDDRELMRMQVMQSLSSPELKGRGISPHLHYFIEKMMAKEADHRFQNFAELIREIREQLDGRDSLDFEAQARSQLSSRRRRRT